MTQPLSGNPPLTPPLPIRSTTDRRVIWVVSLSPDDDLSGLLGDARTIANQSSASVAVLRFQGRASGAELSTPDDWISLGADEVHLLNEPSDSQSLRVAAAQRLWRQPSPWLVLTSADRVGRAWSARLSAVTGWTLVSPALLVQWKSRRLVATRLDGSGRRARLVELPEQQTSIVALRPGVAQSLPADHARRGTTSTAEVEQSSETRVLSVERVAADPGTADIRHLSSLILGRGQFAPLTCASLAEGKRRRTDTGRRSVAGPNPERVNAFRARGGLDADESLERVARLTAFPLNAEASVADSAETAEYRWIRVVARSRPTRRLVPTAS